MYNYFFAKNIHCEDLKKHEQVVLNSKDPFFCLEYAINIFGADIESLGNVILNSKDKKIIKRFKEETRFLNINHSSKVYQYKKMPKKDKAQ